MCLYCDKPDIFILGNIFSMPYMKHNLLPPIIVIYYGIKVNITPEIQSKDPTCNHHCIYFRNDDFIILL